MTLQEIVKKHNVNLHEENVTIVGKDGTLEVGLEDGTLDIRVQLVDRVIVEPDLEIAELL
jgi:hypothetical protein